MTIPDRDDLHRIVDDICDQGDAQLAQAMGRVLGVVRDNLPAPAQALLRGAAILDQLLNQPPASTVPLPPKVIDVTATEHKE